MKKRFIIISGFILVVSALFYVYWNFATKEIIESEYAGVIEELKTDEKEYPYFKLHNESEWYPLFPAIGGQLQVGDSLVKKKGETVVLHYRDGELKHQYNPIW